MKKFDEVYNKIINENKQSKLIEKLETSIKFYVIFNSEEADLEAYGPFKSAFEAKSWMAQEFNDACERAKKRNEDVKWNWNDERLGSCKIEGIGFWEVVKNSK